MKSLASIFGVLMFVLVVMTAMQQVGNHSISNSNLDDNSVSLIGNISGNINTNFNVNTTFDEASSNLTANNTFDSEDVFAQEFLEGKASSNQKIGIVKSIVLIPDLIILSLGVPIAAVAWVKAIVLLILGTLLGFATYRAFFGGGKVTDN